MFTSEASTIALAGDDARAAKLAVGCALSHAVPEMDYGVSSELLHHVYNWLQFQRRP